MRFFNEAVNAMNEEQRKELYKLIADFAETLDLSTDVGLAVEMLAADLAG